jgi:streptomycin 6-kinase
MLQRACALFGELAASQGDRKLLHGDLHHDNILWDATRDWVAVDPKGVIGEPAYEFGAMLRNPTENPELFAHPSIAARRASIIAERLACDADRVLAWGFAQGILSAVWALEDGTNPAGGMATAAAIWPLL